MSLSGYENDKWDGRKREFHYNLPYTLQDSDLCLVVGDTLKGEKELAASATEVGGKPVSFDASE